MNEQMTEEINYRKGYDKGWADAQEYLAKNLKKYYQKIHINLMTRVMKMVQIKKIINLACVDFGEDKK